MQLKSNIIPLSLKKPQRLDIFLTNYFIDLSRTQIKKMITDGNIKVNDLIAKPSLKLIGDEIIFYTLPRIDNINHDILLAEKINLDILYEDDAIIAINKPPNLVVHPGNGNQKGTLANGLIYYFEKLSSLNGNNRPGIIHRLDKDTSGVILIAKDNIVHRNLSKQFEQRFIKKKYYSITWGKWDKKEGLIDLPIARSRKDPTSFLINDAGRSSQTKFSVLKSGRYLNEVNFFPKTGRTHQIRVHASAKNCPVFCDEKYGGGESRAKGLIPEISKELSKRIKYLNRHALHAEEIIFNHPITKKQMAISAPIPSDLRDLLDFNNQLNRN